MKLASSLVLLLLLGPLRADESAPSPCGKSISVDGSITHFKLPTGVVVSGAHDDGTYDEEVYGKSFTATISGLPAGTYNVVIDMAEVYRKGAGQRVMRITSGNTVLADNLDLVTTAGFATAYDRTQIELPQVQTEMLQALLATGKPVVFVNCSGSAVAFPWAAANIPAILQAWYPGGEGGAAVADVLFGKYNPAGRLPVTFYEKTSDLPDLADYSMANRTYRYFTGQVLYPFGFGLSYTSFQYLPPVATNPNLTSADTLHFSVPVKNTGALDGDEVVQVYLHHQDSPVPQPIRSLVAFKRVTVAKSATVDVPFDVPVSLFRYWSETKKDYVLDAGKYDIQIGASSGDIRQTFVVTVQ